MAPTSCKARVDPRTEIIDRISRVNALEKFTFSANHRAADGPLRVVIIATSYNYIRDGVALTLNRLVSYLERHGVEVLIFAPVAKTPALKHAGTLIPVPSIPAPGRPEYRCAAPLPKSAREKIAAFKPHLMHIAMAPDLLGYSAIKLAKKLGIPLVASYHTRYETYLKHYPGSSIIEGLLKSYLKFAYGSAQEVYVPSPSMVDILRADGLRDNFKLWPRGVDTDLFHPNKRNSGFRERHGFGTDDFVVSFVSRLVREKELDSVIATAKALEEKAVPHEMLIVGDGPDREMMQSALPNAIFTGQLHGEALAEAYAAGDAFLFPSETETFGNVTLEAMASGLPALCADASGSRSLVLDGETGYLVAPRDVEGFADRLGGLAADTSLRTKMGRAARARAQNFSWDDCMGRMLSYYQAIAGERQA
nr:glycosyltransferase family 1 protein [Rhizomicrobium palustre]